MKKLSCIILLLLLMIISCGTNTGTDQKETTARFYDEAEETVAEISDDLPENDYGEYEFRIYSYEILKSKIYVETDVGEVIQDAQYNARIKVEERFNVKISFIESGGDDGSHMNMLKNSILADSDDFDLTYAHDIGLCNLTLQNIFVNLYNVPHLDFSKPWWPGKSVGALTVLGQMYVFANAISTDSIGGIRVLYMNREKAEDYGIAMPYQDVFDGSWTMDKLITMTKDLYNDLNGNGEVDEDDFFGYEYRDQYFICTLEPLEIVPVKKDADEILKLNLNNERTLKAVDKMYNLLFGTSAMFFKGDNKGDNMFVSNRAFATCLQLSVAGEKLRYSEVNYGILPMPKLDEMQENYYSGYTSYLCAIPNTARDLDRTGVIVEAMSAEGYKKILPAYYEIALKNKYLQDEESVLMLDLINETKMIDFSWCYNMNFTGPYWFMRDMFFVSSTPSTDFASWYGKNESRINTSLGKIIESFEEMQGN